MHSVLAGQDEFVVIAVFAAVAEEILDGELQATPEGKGHQVEIEE